MVSPAFFGGRRVPSRRRRLRAFAELPDQGANLFRRHYLRFLAVDKRRRRGVDAVLLREGDILVHLCRGLTFHHAHGELALIESRKALGHVGQLAQQVVAVEILLLVEHEIVQRPEVAVALLLRASRGFRRRSRPRMHGQRKFVEHQFHLAHLRWHNFFHHGCESRAVRALEIREDGDSDRGVLLPPHRKITARQPGRQGLGLQPLLDDRVERGIQQLPREKAQIGRSDQLKPERRCPARRLEQELPIARGIDERGVANLQLHRGRRLVFLLHVVDQLGTVGVPERGTLGPGGRAMVSLALRRTSALHHREALRSIRPQPPRWDRAEEWLAWNKNKTETYRPRQPQSKNQGCRRDQQRLGPTADPLSQWRQLPERSRRESGAVHSVVGTAVHLRGSAGTSARVPGRGWFSPIPRRS